MGTFESSGRLNSMEMSADRASTDGTDDDRPLLERAQAGDNMAFEALVRRYERWVFTLALRMVGDRQEAEDLSQEIFLKAYRGLRGFRGASRFSTWLYAIASHHCLNHLASSDARLRRRVWDPEPTGNCGGDAPSVLDRLPDKAPGPDALLEGRDLRRALQNGLAHLSKKHRLIVILRDVQGLPYEEIAATLGLELGTVRSRLHRARMDLKTQLRPYVTNGSEA